MSDVWKKLNLKQPERMVVLNSPSSFEHEIAKLESIRIFRTCSQTRTFDFLLAFVTKLSEVEGLSRQLATKTSDDVVVWFAYPKQTSRRYRCEFNRDTGWRSLGDVGFAGVRQVAIDEDWSAIRFRRVEFIASTKRAPSSASSGQSKKRTN